MPPRTPPTLTIPRNSLVTIAKRLIRAITEKRAMKAELVLRFDDSHLTLEVPDGSDAIPATGHCPGSLRVPGVALILVASGHLPIDPLQHSYSDGYLHIRSAGAHLKFKAHWPDSVSPTP